MKKVFSSSKEVCHVYASDTQPAGRGGNIFFSHGVIYSYGHHFAMAKRVAPDTYLFTTRSYSSSTAKHVSHLRNALNHCTRIYCYDPTASLSDNLRHEQRGMECQLAQAATVKYPTGRGASRMQGYYAVIQSIISRVSVLCAHYNEPVPAWATLPDDMAQASAQYAEAVLVQAAMDAEARAKAQALILAKAKKHLAQWVCGHNTHGRHMYAHQFNQLPVRLRVVDDEVQTSHGARITVANVRTSGIWPVIQQCKANKRGLEFNGLHKPELGYYKADKILPNGTLIAGCHTIPFKELAKVAAIIFTEGGIK